MSESIDVSSKIERLELFEDRLKIRLSGLSAFFVRRDDEMGNYLGICGEVTADDGAKDAAMQNIGTVKSERQVIICIAVYDDSGRVVAHDLTWDSRGSMGFDTFDASIYVPVESVGKIRIYPTFP